MSKIGEFFNKVKFFLGDVRNELYKSTWPTRGELIESTVVVIVSVVLFAVFVGLCDTVLRHVIEIILRR